MSLTRPSEVKALLNELGLHPNRKMGQNFLIDANVLNILMSAAALQKKDVVLEVGPGLGVLTEALAHATTRVIAVEKDRRLVAFLKKRFIEKPQVDIMEGDILDQDLGALLARGVTHVVSNLPYAISSRLLFALAESEQAPSHITVTVQKEVAERIAASTGTNDYGLLSVILQLRYRASIVKEISPTCFLPPPDVKSAIVNLVRDYTLPEPRDRATLHRMLKGAFSQRRKQLAGLLSRLDGQGERRALEIMTAAGINPRARPETVSPDQWVRLADATSPTL